MLSDVDCLFLLDVYAAGETHVPSADSKSLARSIRQRGQIDPIYISDTKKLPAILANQLRDNDMVITQGAGSIGSVARELAEHELLQGTENNQTTKVGDH